MNSILTYQVRNQLTTSLKIEDLDITLQARGGQDSICIISSDAYVRSSSLQELRLKRWIAVHPIYTFAQPSPVRKPPSPPQPAPIVSPPPAPDVTVLQDELRAMHSRFDEMLTLLRAAATQPVAAPVYVQVPISAAEMASAQHVSKSSDPIFIPSNIVPKDASVHINAKEENTEVEDFDDSLAALKAARKKKNNP